MSDVDRVAAALRAGELAVVPTDTVYGIAALPERAAAVFEAKMRPHDKALPVLGCDLDQLAAVAVLGDDARALAARAWPGPLTIVLPRAEGFTADLGGVDRGTVAVRVPAHPAVLRLLGATGPLAVTSANVSGEPPATTFETACALFPGAAALDGGVCDGKPSTVVRVTGDVEVLREGELTGDEIREWLRESRRGS